MRKTSISLIAMAAALAVAPIALADSISGTLGIGGSDTLNSTSNPTSITFMGPGTVFEGNGTFTGASGPATMEGFTFSDANGVELFDVTSGTGAPITFTIEGPVTVTDLSSGTMAINGSGVLTENGFTDTDGTFELTTGTTVAGGLSSTTFQVTAGATGPASPVVPEPSSLVFLGTGLFALALFAFRKARPSGLILHS
jgi:hypothetical protein